MISPKNLLVVLLSFLFMGTRGQETDADDIPPLPYPFEPPSPETCANYTLGSDHYTSIFQPCQFTFYVPDDTSAAPNIITSEDSFSCANANMVNEKEYLVASSRVLGWPDSCVALGPRCYDLTKHPNLANYTNLNVDGSEDYYALQFPENANFVSVDCSADYAKAEEVMQNLPQYVQPVAQAIAFSGIMIFASVLVIVIGIICCVCICCNKGRRRGYTTVGGVYSGPPVEANKLIQV